MIILFGLRRKATRMGTIFMMCAQCQTPAAQALTRIRNWFTLFFIPVIPLGTKYHTTCTLCGRSTQITKEAADTYVAQANQVQPAAEPSDLPPAPILEQATPDANPDGV
jgi:hypothetical protein